MRRKFLRFAGFLIFAAAFSLPVFSAQVLRAEQAGVPPPSPGQVKADIDVDSLEIDYEEIKKAYEYDPETPLNIEIEETRDFPGYAEYTFFYDSLKWFKKTL